MCLHVVIFLNKITDIDKFKRHLKQIMFRVFIYGDINNFKPKHFVTIVLPFKSNNVQ